jgi:dTDP-4-amino-4,6-dideoxygalactose transaminase
MMPFIAHDITKMFEERIAEYAGSRYAVAVDSCCNALFLSCVFLGAKNVTLPKFTYPGVACAVINSGGNVEFSEHSWSGAYALEPYNLIDSALRFKRNMYVKGSLYCISFHVKKHLPIGRGGMILTDNKIAYDWLKKARFDGRNAKPLHKDKIDMVGWNCYMTPEQAARGLTLLDLVKDKDLPDMDSTKQGYPDLSKIEAYK